MRPAQSKGMLTTMVMLPTALAELESPDFLNLGDEDRETYLNNLTMRYLLAAKEIREGYMQAVLKLNPLVVGQLREVFAGKIFQTADERQRQSMLDILMKQPSVSEGPYRIPKHVVERIMREESTDKPGSVFNVMQQVRQVFQSPMFNRFSQADQQRYFELMLQQPQILKVNLTRDDLLKAYYEIEANTAAINRITADPLFLILTRLEPREVLKTCGLTRQFARLCQNPNLFAALMHLHYPNSFETTNPKEQYKAITMGLETTYRIARDNTIVDKDGREYWTTFKNPVQYGKTQLPHRIPGFKLTLSISDLKRFLGPGYIPESIRHLIGQENSILYRYVSQNGLGFQTSPEEIEKLFAAGKISQYQLEGGRPENYLADHDTEVVFSVKGYPITAGTKAWLLILESHAAGIEDTVQVFKTKEALAKSFIENEYPQLKQTLADNFAGNDEDGGALGLSPDHGPDEIERVLIPSPQWRAYIQDAQLPYPFTAENVYKYLMDNDHIQIYPNSERDSWLLNEVTF